MKRATVKNEDTGNSIVFLKDKSKIDEYEYCQSSLFDYLSLYEPYTEGPETGSVDTEVDIKAGESICFMNVYEGDDYDEYDSDFLLQINCELKYKKDCKVSIGGDLDGEIIEIYAPTSKGMWVASSGEYFSFSKDEVARINKSLGKNYKYCFASPV